MVELFRFLFEVELLRKDTIIVLALRHLQEINISRRVGRLSLIIFAPLLLGLTAFFSLTFNPFRI